MLPLSGWSPIQSSLQLCGLQWMADRLWWLTVAGRFLPPNRSRLARYKYATHTSSPVTPQVKLCMSSMFTASSAVIALLLMTTGRALAQDLEQQGNPGGCETLLERREWSVIYLWGSNSLTLLCRRTLSDVEKSDYINAVKCLQTLPSKDPNLTAAKSRFDEFHALHLQKADSVHVTVCRVWIYTPFT